MNETVCAVPVSCSGCTARTISFVTVINGNTKRTYLRCDHCGAISGEETFRRVTNVGMHLCFGRRNGGCRPLTYEAWEKV